MYGSSLVSVYVYFLWWGCAVIRSMSCMLLVECCDFVHVSIGLVVGCCGIGQGCDVVGAVVLGRAVMLWVLWYWAGLWCCGCCGIGQGCAVARGCWLLRALICKSRAKFFSSFLSVSLSVSPSLSLPPLIIIHGEH